MPQPGCDRDLEVDLIHGYETCPPDLFSTIANLICAQRLDPTVARDQAGPFIQDRTNLTNLGTWLDRDKSTTLARYSLGPQP